MRDINFLLLYVFHSFPYPLSIVKVVRLFRRVSLNGYFTVEPIIPDVVFGQTCYFPASQKGPGGAGKSKMGNFIGLRNSTGRAPAFTLMTLLLIANLK